jgi:hypothetical protein
MPASLGEDPMHGDQVLDYRLSREGYIRLADALARRIERELRSLGFRPGWIDPWVFRYDAGSSQRWTNPVHDIEEWNRHGRLGPFE